MAEIADAFADQIARLPIPAPCWMDTTFPDFFDDVEYSGSIPHESQSSRVNAHTIFSSVSASACFIV